MLKRHSVSISVGLILAVLFGMLYCSSNQADYDKRTLLPAQFTNGITEPMFFEKGTYTFTFEYIYAPGAQAQIVRLKTADENNVLPKVLVSAPLQESGQTTFTLTLSQAMYDLQLRVTNGTALGFTHVESVGRVWSDTQLLLLLAALAAAVMVFIVNRERRGRLAPSDTGCSGAAEYALLLAAALFVTLPVIRDFLINGHDLSYHLLRIESIKDALLDGQFPVRISPAFWNGLGDASSMLYPELFLYIPAVFRLCGVSLLAAFEAFVFLINLATFVITYHAVKRLTGRASIGLIVSLVYGFGVNRLITLFTRAAVGEALAMIFLPCVMLGMAEALHHGKLSKWLITGMTGLIQSHIVSVEIALLFCILYMLIVIVMRKTTWRNLGKLFLAVGITIMINLWFLVPFFRFWMEDLRIFSYVAHTVQCALYPAQWFASFVNPLGTALFLGTTAEMPLSVGVLPAVGILLYLLAHPKDDRVLRAVGRVSLGFGLLALFITSTAFPWAYVATLPVLRSVLLAVQFPWRYLGIAGFLLAMVFAVSAHTLGNGRNRLLIAVCLLLAVFNAAPFLNAFVQSDAQEYVMKNKLDMATAIDIYQPLDYAYADTDFALISEQTMSITAPPEVSITGFTKLGTQVSFTYATESEQSVILPLYRYPGYTAKLNGAQALTISETNHLLTLILPPGEGTVLVRYTGFWYYNLANFLSLLTLLALLALAARKLPHWKRQSRQPGSAAV